jgi:hypothetical protein
VTSPPELPLAQQRQALRERMREQRQLIAEQLGPGPDAGGGYPRSKTMRFLTQRSGLVTTLLAEGIALLVGVRYAKSATAVMALARVVRAASTGRSNGSTAGRAND